MKINFGDIVPLSTLDWPGKATMTLFLRGCVFECPYCQNYELLDGESLVGLDEIKSRIVESEKFIDGVIVSGGEPLYQPEVVEELSEFTHQRELKYGLHTNGYFNCRLDKLLEKDCLDFVSLDIKAPLDDEEKYSRLCGRKIDLSRIEESYRVLEKSEVCLEITTTFFDEKMSLNDLEKIKDRLSGEKYVIQQGRTENAYREEYKKLETITKESLLNIAKELEYNNLYIRTKEEGEEKV